MVLATSKPMPRLTTDIIHTLKSSPGATTGPCLCGSRNFTPSTILPNPIKNLLETSALPAPGIVRFYKPDTWYDGTQIMVEISDADVEVSAYNIYVSAYEDGTGASRLASGPEPTQLVRRLRAEFPLYFFATYTNMRRQESKPSEVQRLLLEDDFPNK